jgi:hypothetical protein
MTDVLEALGGYKCDAGMPNENVPAVVNIIKLKERFMAQVLGGGEECGKEEKCCWPLWNQV